MSVSRIEAGELRLVEQSHLGVGSALEAGHSEDVSVTFSSGISAGVSIRQGRF